MVGECREDDKRQRHRHQRNRLCVQNKGSFKSVDDDRQKDSEGKPC